MFCFLLVLGLLVVGCSVFSDVAVFTEQIRLDQFKICAVNCEVMGV